MTKRGDARVSFDSAKDCDCFIITYGFILAEARKAADALEKDGVKCGVILLEKLLPLNEPVCAILDGLAGSRTAAPIIFLEEGVKNGGLGECICEELRHDALFNGRKYEIKAINDPLARVKGVCSTLKFHKISADDVYAGMKTLLAEK